MLRTFAIGVAAAWMVAVLDIAWKDKPVDLPSASEDVLYVFPREARFIPRGGAGCGGREDTSCPPYSFPAEKPALAQMASLRADELRFKFTNDTSCDIYVAYGPKDTDGTADYPYRTECKDAKGHWRDVGPDFHFVPALQVLAPGEDFVFDVKRPKLEKQCKLLAGYHRDPRAYELISSGDVNEIIARKNHRMFEKSARRVGLRLKP